MFYCWGCIEIGWCCVNLTKTMTRESTKQQLSPRVTGRQLPVPPKLAEPPTPTDLPWICPNACAMHGHDRRAILADTPARLNSRTPSISHSVDLIGENLLRIPDPFDT